MTTTDPTRDDRYSVFFEIVETRDDGTEWNVGCGWGLSAGDIATAGRNAGDQIQGGEYDREEQPRD